MLNLQPLKMGVCKDITTFVKSKLLQNDTKKKRGARRLTVRDVKIVCRQYAYNNETDSRNGVATGNHGNLFYKSLRAQAGKTIIIK